MKLGLLGTLIAAMFVPVGFIVSAAWIGFCGGYNRALDEIDSYTESEGR